MSVFIVVFYTSIWADDCDDCNGGPTKTFLDYENSATARHVLH